MKATIEVPDELYRRVKARCGQEGRAVREVEIDLFPGYVGQKRAAPRVEPTVAQEAARAFAGEIPPWFGAFEKYARRVERHGMEAIRESIGRGVAAERAL